MRLFDFVLPLVLFANFSAAWAWPPFEQLNDALVRRQNEDQSTTAEPASTADSGAAQETGTRTDDAEVSSTEDGEVSVTDSPSETDGGAQETGSSRTTRSGNNDDGDSSSSTSRRRTTVAPGGAAGGISMLTPAQTSTTFVAIGNNITFVWNYTNLAITPSYIDVVATNTQGTWTVTSNMTAEETGSVVWDTGDTEPSLIMAGYTLVVYDSEDGPTAAPEPGRLSPYLGYPFAMYFPRDDQDQDSYFCVTCNAGVTSAERQSLRVLMLVATLTVMSFTYFASGFLGI